MLDQLRRDIQTRLDELLSEAQNLRHALAALGSHTTATPTATATASSSPTRSRRRTRSAPAAATAIQKPARPGKGAKSTTAPASPEPVQSPVATSSTGPRNGPPRTARGATKSAVLAALASGNSMTAGEVASTSGLGRASVSTTLAKLAKTGEVTKAARGYQIAGQATTEPAAAAGSAEDAQPVT